MSKSKLIIIGAAAAGVIAAVVLYFVFFAGKTDYRLLKIFEFDGSGTVTRQSKGEMTPYANMVLESGDKVALKTGKLTIQADEDKFIYFDENTEIELVASGTGDNSKTKIQLLSGGITNDIRNKLSSDSSYEINTPNSTMSVRGTVFSS